MIVSRRIFLRKKNILETSAGKNISENRAVYEIVWKNLVQPDRPHVIS